MCRVYVICAKTQEEENQRSQAQQQHVRTCIQMFNAITDHMVVCYFYFILSSHT